MVSDSLAEAFRHAIGPDVTRFLDQENVTDVILNEDGKLWVDAHGEGRRFTGCMISPSNADATLRLIAHHCGVPLTSRSPIVSATLPISGERIAGTIPPITCAPTFSIRKPPKSVFEIDKFLDGNGSTEYEEKLKTAVDQRRNVLIAGSTGSGKTSLLSALLQLESVKRDRILVIEDTQELVISSDDCVRFLTTPEVDQKSLVELSLRFRPDRIVVGEVRSGQAALEMITAMNTGHEGSFGTIHANSAAHAITRMNNLCARVCNQTPTQEILEAIHCIVFLAKRRIKEIRFT